MKVIRLDAAHLPALSPSAAAIGYFDGFHRGHKELLKKTLQLAREYELVSAVITFSVDPWTIFRPRDNRDNLISLSDKLTLAKNLGLDYVYVLEFDLAFANRSVESFHEVLQQMNVRQLVCGYDFTYGFKGMGNTRSLEMQKRFAVHVIDEVDDKNEKISSTRIERLIREGLVAKAAALLGYFYSVPGVIVHGYGRGGKLLEYPTANLQPEKDYVLPSRGVYAGFVYDGHGFFEAMINIGSNPTFDNGQVSIEAHIFDYRQDLYGRIVRFFFALRLRPEVRFSSVEELKNQLARDAASSRILLKEQEKLWAATLDLWKDPDDFDILEL